MYFSKSCISSRLVSFPSVNGMAYLPAEIAPVVIARASISKTVGVGEQPHGARVVESSFDNVRNQVLLTSRAGKLPPHRLEENCLRTASQPDRREMKEA